MTGDPETGDEQQDTAGDAQQDTTGDKKSRWSYDWKRHLPRLVLLVGLSVVALSMVPALPRDQVLVFRLDEGLGPVRKLDATWTRYGQDEPAGGVRLSFPDGAPSHVRHRIKVPNGEYVLGIVLERDAPETTSRGRANLAGEHTASMRYVRRVDLEGGETIIELWQEN